MRFRPDAKLNSTSVTVIGVFVSILVHPPSNFPARPLPSTSAGISCGLLQSHLLTRTGRTRLVSDDWEEVPSSGAGGNQSSRPSDAADESESGRALGASNAPVTIVEYGDFQSPYCGQAESTLRDLRDHYGNKLRIVFRDYPLGFHRYAIGAALAARCAGAQGKFWQYHDAIFANPGALSEADLKNLAANLGLNTEQFDHCLDSREYEQAIERDKRAGTRIGVRGTPYFLINGEALYGARPYQAFKTAIDRALAQSRSASE
jgi:protein-disulfide isomerase